jgi:hypothetical protein
MAQVVRSGTQTRQLDVAPTVYRDQGIARLLPPKLSFGGAHVWSLSVAVALGIVRRCYTLGGKMGRSNGRDLWPMFTPGFRHHNEHHHILRRCSHGRRSERPLPTSKRSNQ